jgi:ligand-binding sensor domain-containing protein
MAWAQIGRAQEGIGWTIKANAAVDTGRVPGFSRQRGPDPDCKGWFLVRLVESVSNVNTASVSAVRDFPAGVLIGTLNGLFRARMENGVVSVGRAGNADTGTVWAVRDLPGGGMLIGATSGLFLARVENGALIIERAGNAAGGFAGTPADFAGGVLIGSTNGWFLARTQNGAVIVDRAGGEDPAPVFTMHDFPAGGV